jgi:hypothetical protein
MKTGRYIIEENNPNNFYVYTEDKSLIDANNKPFKSWQGIISLTKRETGTYWSYYSTSKHQIIDADKVPNTLASFAHALCLGR